ncbi:MAG: sugar phosphate isomerase/epimerase [Desulfobacterales bacterium]|nr:MAG: sugar phosphate isomerase/epimerase [Desulfobacterales bacterium]
MLRLGYNTNGFNCHSLESALDIISDLGYRGVAITLDNYVLNPRDPDLDRKLAHTKATLKKKALACVVETGARFLLNPRRKHEPTLISADAAGRQTRLSFLKSALDIAARLDAEALSFWSGTRHDDAAEADAWEWLLAGCRELLDYSAQYGIPLAFEPEPGMFIENLSQYQNLKQRLDHHLWGLTLDLGHAYLTEDRGPAACIRQFKDDIKNIHAEDMRKGAHEHLQFGEGEMDFIEVFKALEDISYTGLVNVELSRHSRNAVKAAEHAFQFLAKLA